MCAWEFNDDGIKRACETVDKCYKDACWSLLNELHYIIKNVQFSNHDILDFWCQTPMFDVHLCNEVLCITVFLTSCNKSFQKGFRRTCWKMMERCPVIEHYSIYKEKVYFYSEMLFR